eukprot:jgi/Tetstr1/448314/TSEL_035598.t1
MYFNTVVKEFVDINKTTKNEASETLIDRFTVELKAQVNNDKYSQTVQGAVDLFAPVTPLLRLTDSDTPCASKEQLGKLEMPFLDKDAGKANAKKMAAAEWWHQYGGHVPDMQLVVVRCLAHIARACGAERGHKEMNFIKSKVRNRLTIPMTEKLIYTRHNIMQLERRKRLGFREEPLAWYMWNEKHDDSMEVGWGDAWGNMT